MSDVNDAGDAGDVGGREAKTLKCPKCDAVMEKVAFGGIEVDRCTSCKGLWFDALEREKLKDVKGSESIDVGKAAAGRAAPAGAAASGADDKRRFTCPVCRTPMIRMVDVDQRHLHYESCTVCFGAFFDAGEFRDYKDHTFADFFRDLFSRERK
jgi:Zn-finger nucleic acid-binding protein